MTLLKYIFVFLHIATAAAWFGMALRLSAQARLAARVGGASAAAVSEETRRGINLMGIFLLLTFAFGLGAFLLGGAFAVYGMEFHTSLLLILILIAVHYALIGPRWDRFGKALTTDHPQDAEAHRKKLAMFLGIGHLLWMVILFLMLWRYFQGAIIMM